MKAILVSEANLSKINVSDTDPFHNDNSFWTYAVARSNYYAIVDYVDVFGTYHANLVVLPEYVIKNNFTYDFEKLRTDWDTIYRL